MKQQLQRDVREFLDHLKENKSKHTYRQQEQLWRRLLYWLDPQDNRSLSIIANDFVKNHTKTKAFKSYQTYVGFVKSFAEWCQDEGLTDYGDIRIDKFRPSKEYEIKLDQKNFQRYEDMLTKEEVSKILDYCAYNDQEMYVIVLLLYNLGMRASEVTELQKMQIERLQIKGETKHFIRRYSKAEGPRGRTRYSQISKEVYDLLHRWMSFRGVTEDHQYVFARIVRGELRENPPSYDWLRNKIHALTGTKRTIGRKVDTHTFRRSRITELRNDQVPDRDISLLCNVSMAVLHLHYDVNKYSHNQLKHFVT